MNKRLRVKRTEWLRGQDGNTSELLDDKGRSDIVGHCMRRINNVTKDRLEGELYPDDVFNGPSLFTGNDGMHNDFASECMKHNDDASITDATRERRLIQLFAEQGIELVFVD